MIELERDKPSVMIVDDVPEIRALLSYMLKDLGFETVVEASDGADALEKLKKDRTHLILCDHCMEKMSGLDLLSQLRNHPYLVDIPFIVVSAVSAAPVIATALDLGAEDYLLKPFAFENLKEKVIEVFRRRHDD